MNFPSTLPQSWSELTWRQLCDVWASKMRYGGNAAVSRSAAFLALLPSCPASACDTDIRWHVERGDFDPTTGERQYLLVEDFPPSCSGGCRVLSFTPRELSQAAQQALPWFAFPYGDPGEPAEKDENGKVLKEGRTGHLGYVNPNWRDAMELPEDKLVVCGKRMFGDSEWQQMSGEEQYQVFRCEFGASNDYERRRLLSKSWKRMNEAERDRVLHSPLLTLRFALPQKACINITWEQYRTLQVVVPQLFRDGIADEQTVELQAQFLSYCLTPAQEQVSASDHFSPSHVYKFQADRADQTVPFWREQLTVPAKPDRFPAGALLFNLCFQVYHTAVLYYERVYPLLFVGSGKNSDPLEDALTGEIGTLNSIMKYQGYTSPQEVYDTNLPIILSTLNTMAKEAKEIERINAKMKKK